jgi:hypothetical protein
MKIYVTKKSPMEYICGGADRFDVWFERPHFHRGLFVCAIGGLIPIDRVQHPRWQGRDDSCFSLYWLRKTQSTLFAHIWQAVQATYREPHSLSMEEKWYHARKTYRQKNAKSLGNHSTALANTLSLYIDIQVDFRCLDSVEYPQQHWDQWIGEYDIEMTLNTSL